MPLTKVTPAMIGTTEFSVDGNNTSVRPEWWGARADNGVTDNFAAFDAMMKFLDSIGGGTVELGIGTYVFKTMSTDPDTYFSLILPYDNINIVGQGQGVSILKMGDGMVAANPGIVGPNMLGTKQATPLTKFLYRDFTIDMNAANNLLVSPDARHNAGFISYNGVIDGKILRVTIKNVAGAQCIFSLGYQFDYANQRTFTVEECSFENVGSAVPGNYNIDHTSVNVYGNYNKIINCNFLSDAPVAGTAFEHHGSNCEAYDNSMSNYGQLFYAGVASGTGWTGENISIYNNVAVNCQTRAFAFDAQGTKEMYHFNLYDNYFRAKAGLTNDFIDVVQNQSTHFNFRRNIFIGSGAGQRLITVAVEKELNIQQNHIESFSNNCIALSNTVPGGMTRLRISDNDFVNCATTGYLIYLPAGSPGTIALLEISRNTIRNSSPNSNIILKLDAPIQRGIFSDNLVDSNTTGVLDIDVAAKNLEIHHECGASPSTYCGLESTWLNSATNTKYVSNSSNQWV